MALREYESRFLNSPDRSVNRKVQGSNPCSGANSPFWPARGSGWTFLNWKSAPGGSSKGPTLDVVLAHLEGEDEGCGEDAHSRRLRWCVVSGLIEDAAF